jgi:hypothetical protein
MSLRSKYGSSDSIMEERKELEESQEQVLIIPNHDQVKKSVKKQISVS